MKFDGYYVSNLQFDPFDMDKYHHYLILEKNGIARLALKIGDVISASEFRKSDFTWKLGRWSYGNGVEIEFLDGSLVFRGEFEGERASLHVVEDVGSYDDPTLFEFLPFESDVENQV